MKTDLFKVRHVLSTTAVTLLMASSLSYAQDVEFQKLDKSYYPEELLIQKELDKKTTTKDEKKLKESTFYSKFEEEFGQLVDKEKVADKTQKKKINPDTKKILESDFSDIDSSGYSKLKEELGYLTDKESSKKKEKNIDSATEQELAQDLQNQEDLKNKETRPKVEKVSTIKAAGIKEIKVDLEANLDIEALQSKIKRAKVKPVSTIKAAGIKEFDTESALQTTLLDTKSKDKEIDTATESELASDLEGKEKFDKENEKTETVAKSDSASNSLITLVCSQKTQIEELQEELSSFKTSIEQSLLTTQQLVQQLALMNMNNRGGWTRADSVFDRYDSMYPFLMMKGMYDDMRMDRMMDMFTRNMPNSFTDPRMLNYYYGQQQDAAYNYTSAMPGPLGQFSYNFDENRALNMLTNQQAMHDSANAQNLLLNNANVFTPALVQPMNAKVDTTNTNVDTNTTNTTNTENTETDNGDGVS